MPILNPWDFVISSTGIVPFGMHGVKLQGGSIAKFLNCSKLVVGDSVLTGNSSSDNFDSALSHVVLKVFHSSSITLLFCRFFLSTG